ncbi:unnamed protein product [Chrysoparadoxa australica]
MKRQRHQWHRDDGNVPIGSAQAPFQAGFACEADNEIATTASSQWPAAHPSRPESLDQQLDSQEREGAEMKLKVLYTHQKTKKRKAWTDGVVRCHTKRLSVTLHRWSEATGIAGAPLGEAYLTRLEMDAFLNMKEPEIEMERYLVTRDGLVEEGDVGQCQPFRESHITNQPSQPKGTQKRLFQAFKVPKVAPKPPSQLHATQQLNQGPMAKSFGVGREAPGGPGPLGRRGTGPAANNGFGTVTSLWDDQEEEEEEEGEQDMLYWYGAVASHSQQATGAFHPHCSTAQPRAPASEAVSQDCWLQQQQQQGLGMAGAKRPRTGHGNRPAQGPCPGMVQSSSAHEPGPGMVQSSSTDGQTLAKELFQGRLADVREQPPQLTWVSGPHVYGGGPRGLEGADELQENAVGEGRHDGGAWGVPSGHMKVKEQAVVSCPFAYLTPIPSLLRRCLSFRSNQAVTVT